MKRIFTLFTVLCLLTVCILPVGAVSFDLADLTDDYVIGTPNTLFEFKGSDAASFTQAHGDSLTDAEGILTAKRTDTTKMDTVDIYYDEMLSAYSNERYVLSFSYSLDYPTAVKVSSGATHSASNEVMREELTAYGTEGEWRKVDILFDNAAKRYYLWQNASGDILSSVPDVDACEYSNRSKVQKSFRLWTNGIPEGETAALRIKEITVSPLKPKAKQSAVSYLNQVKGGYIYQENFDSYTPSAYTGNTTAEPWKTWLTNTVIDTTTGTGNTKCNAADMSIVSEGTNDNRLEITAAAANTYHNFIFTKTKGVSLPTYDAQNKPNVNTVIQLKIKASSEARLLLGKGAASAANISLRATAAKLEVNNTNISSTSSFVVSENFESADYTTLTFLLHDNNGTANDTYSLWINNVPIVQNIVFAGTTKDYTKIDRLNFLCAAKGTRIWIDDIRVYEPADSDFLKIYSFKRLNGDLDIDKIKKVGEDGQLSGFKSAAELDAPEDVTLSYLDSVGYINGSDIQYPLFADTAVKVRAVLSSGEYQEKTDFDAVTFPSGYIAKSEAAKNESQVSIPVMLRNTQSARPEEVIAIAAAYQGGALVKTCICTFNEATNAYEGNFGENVTCDKVCGFIWQKDTLKPVT